MDKAEWIKQAAAQYRKNGLFEKDDGMISKSDSEDWAQQLLISNPDLIDEDPQKCADSSDISNWFGDDKDKD